MVRLIILENRPEQLAQCIDCNMTLNRPYQVLNRISPRWLIISELILHKDRTIRDNVSLLSATGSDCATEHYMSISTFIDHQNMTVNS